MPDVKLNERDGKLVQWLNEAHAKEAELEADLTAHIALTDKASYKKRLQQHLRETRDHKRRVASRIKKLGADAGAPAIPGLPRAAGEVAGKAVAAVKGQVGAARAAITEKAETHLRKVMEKAGGFALHLLTASQQELAGAFTRPTVVSDGKIGGLSYRPGTATGDRGGLIRGADGLRLRHLPRLRSAGASPRADGVGALLSRRPGDGDGDGRLGCAHGAATGARGMSKQT